MKNEDKLQADCFQWFWNTYPELRFTMWAVPNGGSRNKIEAMKLKATGVVAGVHDLHFLHDGQFFTFELKVGRNTLSPKQKAFASAIETHKGKWFEIRDVETFKKIVQEIIHN